MRADLSAFQPMRHGLFMQSMGLTFDTIAGDRVTAHLDVGADQHTPWGVVHGGVFAAVVESVASVGASVAVADRGMYAVGLNNSTDFLRPVTSAHLDVLGIPIQQGRTQQLWLVTMAHPGGKDVARGQLRLQNVPLPAEGAAP
jgi:1,4-dihydroxy-2-naphthoyl-CoA hydrolase